MNKEIQFTEIEQLQQTVLLLLDQNQELEMRLANAEAWIDKLKPGYYKLLEGG